MWLGAELVTNWRLPHTFSQPPSRLPLHFAFFVLLFDVFLLGSQCVRHLGFAATHHCLPTDVLTRLTLDNPCLSFRLNQYVRSEGVARSITTWHERKLLSHLVVAASCRRLWRLSVGT